ncbi:MAG: glycosyl hydrolase [Planctomycetota bacterium]|nr:glycosyl hydrolase [Planctomycetota bacterium]
MNLACRVGILLSLFGALCPAAEPSVPVLPPLPTEERPLAERFAVPPPSARMLRILHSQKDNAAEQDQQLRTLAAQGFGGFAGNVAFDGYVDDETKWPAFLRGVRLAKAAGMSLWLYDECGYPSGSARDLTLRGHPEWAARGLLVAEANTRGGPVSLALPPGRLVLAAALPRRDGVIALDETQDLTASINGGQLSWQAPAGEWFVVVMTDDLLYEGTHAAVSLAFKKPCIDLLTPEPTARFLEVTHARYAEKLGQDLGRYFVSTFTDEPSLQNLWLRPMPYRVLPWSLTIEREFSQRRGRELRPLLPALVAEAGPAGARARYDFWNTVGELVSENYFGQIQTWCRKHNLLSGGHLLMEEGLVGHVPLYGHFFRCLRRLDAPSIDCLTSLPPQVPWYIARLIGSAADLEGRTVTMCEVSDHGQRYRPKGDTRPIRIVTEDEIRGTCNRLVWGGINTLTSYYAFQDLTAEQLQRINTHVGRCQTMLRGGHQVTDIAVLYPLESVWPRFVPAHHGATDEPAARRVESVFDGVSGALYAANRDFAYVDAQALREAKVADGTLTHGQLRWRVLVLPAADTLPLEAWENVAAFCRRGGVVIAIGTRPANSEVEFSSPRVQEIACELFGTADAPCLITNPAGGAGLLLPTAMIALVPRLVDSLFERAAVCAEAKAPVKITRRRIDGQEVYFAINDSDAVWEGGIRFCGRGVSEQWNPATGVMTPLANGTQVPVRLGPYGAMLFRSATADVPKRLGGTVAASLSTTCEPLPKTPQPAASHGEFVRSELTGDDISGWRAAATLTKGQVDTFLFLNFPYTEPLNLTACEGLAIDASVPQGQRTGTELLVFLNTANGGRFLAGTGHYLNVPGSCRAYVMFCQFKPFGQTQGELDLSKIASVSIGWGGYLGTAGERITLTVKPPQRFVCGAK